MHYRRILRTVASTSLFGGFGEAVLVLFAFAGLYSIVAEAYKAGSQLNLATFSGTVQVVGFAALGLISLQSLARAIYKLSWREKRVLASLGTSKVALRIPETSSEIYVVGQNLRTAFSSRGIKVRLIELLSKEKGPRIYIIGATYDGMKAISPECALHFLDTLVDLK